MPGLCSRLETFITLRACARGKVIGFVHLSSSIGRKITRSDVLVLIGLASSQGHSQLSVFHVEKWEGLVRDVT